MMTALLGVVKRHPIFTFFVLAYAISWVVLPFEAVKFWYAWLFNHTGGSVLMVVVAHSVEGSIQAEIGWVYMGVWLAVAIGLVVFDWKSWRGPAPATTAPAIPPREAAPAAP